MTVYELSAPGNWDGGVSGQGRSSVASRPTTLRAPIMTGSVSPRCLSLQVTKIGPWRGVTMALSACIPSAALCSFMGSCTLFISFLAGVMRSWPGALARSGLSRDPGSFHYR